MMDSGAVVTNSTSLALVTVATALVGVWVWLQQKPRRDFPPGPKGWPLLGNLLDFRDKPATQLFTDYAKEYGDIYAIRIGQTWTVVLNGATVIKEALLKKGAEFAGRAVSYNADLSSEGGKNIVFGQYNQTWKLHRKLAHSAFRKLATGNNERFEKIVHSVLPALAEHLDSKGTEPFDPRSSMASAIYNLLITMCFGKTYDFDSPYLKELIHLSHRETELVGNGLLADYYPVFKYVPTPAQRELTDIFAWFNGIIEDEMQKHRESFDPANEPADLTDLLLHARQEIIEEGKEDISLITDTHMRQTIADIFGAGTDTSIYTLTWCVSLLVDHPEVQAKVAAEIDEIVGRDRLPTLDDRETLPYTVAALYEVMRYSTIAPMAIPHATTKEVTLGGYTIPEGTWVMVNIASMHFDDKLWDKPQEYRPEHFFDEAGKIRLHPEGFLPFSTGRRVCLGESVAKAELFLLFAWLFQHYEFSKVPGTEGQNYGEPIDTAILRSPKDVTVVVKRRF